MPTTWIHWLRHDNRLSGWSTSSILIIPHRNCYFMYLFIFLLLFGVCTWITPFKLPSIRFFVLISQDHVLLSNFFLHLLRELTILMHPFTESISLFFFWPEKEKKSKGNSNKILRTYFNFLFTDRFSKVNVSQIKSNLIFLSRGESVPNEDKWLTSISHGLIFSSIMMSKPII